MNKKNPLIPFLTKMTSLMDLIHQHKGALSALPPHLQEQLQSLTQDVARMNQEIQGELNSLQVDPKLLQAELLHSKNIPRKDKEAFMNINHLKQEAEVVKKELSKSRSPRKKSTSSKTKNSSSLNQTTKRRKRFKPLGDDKNWIPL